MAEIEKSNVKREHWKGKYQSVARNEKGQITARIKWSRKNNIKRLQRAYNKHGSFIKGTKRIKLKKVTEHLDFRDKPKIPAGVMYSYVIEGTLKDGKTITARSMQHHKSYPISKAREEARTSFFERLAQAFNRPYDEDEGKAVADRFLVRMKEGVIYYKQIQ